MLVLLIARLSKPHSLQGAANLFLHVAFSFLVFSKTVLHFRGTMSRPKAHYSIKLSGALHDTYSSDGVRCQPFEHLLKCGHSTGHGKAKARHSVDVDGVLPQPGSEFFGRQLFVHDDKLCGRAGANPVLRSAPACALQAF
jgi:hypothetical protein